MRDTHTVDAQFNSYDLEVSACTSKDLYDGTKRDK